MSEQPNPSQYNQPSKEGTRFDDSANEARFDLHRNITVPDYNAPQIAAVRDMPIMREPTPEELNAAAIRHAGLMLSNLQVVRSAHTKVER